MRKFHKGLLVGGVALAVLVPAGMVAADQGGEGRGPANATRDCTGDQAQDRIQARDGPVWPALLSREVRRAS